jgi:hypothetical protein
MLVGQYFMRFGAGVYQYSPTFPRGGLSAVFAVEVFALMSGASLDVAVEYKNVEDTSWTTYGSAISASTTGVHTLQVAGIKEEVRLRFSVGGANPSDTVYANALAPQWRPY